MLVSADKDRLIRIAAEQAYNAILVTDAGTNGQGPLVLYCNPAFCRMTGYSEEELLDQSPRMLQGPETDPAVIQSLREALRQGSYWEGRTVNYRKDGQTYVVNWNISPVLDSAGHCSHYISTSWNVDDLVEREKALHAMAMEDKLTGLLSRRAGDDQLQEAFHAWRSEQQPMSLIICDIDHFKAVNDRFGHPTGDRVIQHIAATLAKQLRSSDTAIRWGGEEFMIIAQTQLTEASQLAERLRAAIAELEDDEVGTVTMSFGVAEACSDSLQQLISRADKALYQAKRNGRDQVCCDRPAT